MRTILLLLFVLTSAGCLRKTEFQCNDDSACGANGRCETTGYCSFVDPDCQSGRRYDQSAGPLAGQCTGGGNPNDGRIDTPTNDGPMTDTPPAGCPSGYVTLTGGEGNHVYKVLTVTQNWNTQEGLCQATSGSSHLAVPGEINELTALDTAAGAATNHWLGITDAANEGTYLSVFGGTQTYLPWEPPAPDNAGGGQGEDCVESLNSATHTINDRRCNDKLAAVCECVPP